MNKREAMARAFGIAVLEHRKGAGLRQYQLAAKASLGANHVNRLECARNHPEISALVVIAEALDMDPVDLFKTTLVHYEAIRSGKVFSEEYVRRDRQSFVEAGRKGAQATIEKGRNVLVNDPEWAKEMGRRGGKSKKEKQGE